MFLKCGKLRQVTVAKKKDPKRAGQMLSMGYGFVEYKRKSDADKAIKLLQVCFEILMIYYLLVLDSMNNLKILLSF